MCVRSVCGAGITVDKRACGDGFRAVFTRLTGPVKSLWVGRYASGGKSDPLASAFG